jgi:hypothetical protein
MMLDFQLQIETLYRKARRNQKTHPAYLKFITAMVKGLDHRAFAQFLDEIFVPVGGWKSTRSAITDQSFRKSLEEQWNYSQFVAIQVEYQLRCLKYKPERAGANKAAQFVERAPLKGGKANINRSDASTLWGAHKTQAPLLFAALHFSYDNFLLKNTFDVAAAGRSGEIAATARQLLEVSNIAAERLMTIKTIADKQPNFLVVTLPGGMSSSFETLPLEPFLDDELKAIREYKTNGAKTQKRVEAANALS